MPSQDMDTTILCHLIIHISSSKLAGQSGRHIVSTSHYQRQGSLHLSPPRLREFLMPFVDLLLQLQLPVIFQQDQLDGILDLGDSRDGRNGDEGRCVVGFAGPSRRGLQDQDRVGGVLLPELVFLAAVA